MKVCVIPARGGSKRIPRKNVRDFAGRPMLAWPIDAARRSGLFDRIVVSTDDDEIAQVARGWGAETPFMRPPELADDHATTVAVIAHAVQELRLDAPDDLVCCLYATAPMIRADDLREGLRVLSRDRSASYAVSVVRFEYPIERALRILPSGRLALRDPALVNTRSQDLEPAYHDAGQFYWGRAEAFRQQEPMLGPNALPVLLPSWRTADIDTPDDWVRAELLFQIARQQGTP